MYAVGAAYPDSLWADKTLDIQYNYREWRY